MSPQIWFEPSVPFERLRRTIRAAVGAVFAAAAAVALSMPAMAQSYQFLVQDDEHLEFARALSMAALQKAGMEAEFLPAPESNEQRKLFNLIRGESHLDLMPATPRRLEALADGKIWMVPIPLDRGLLGYRLGLLLQQDGDLLADVNTLEDLQNFTIGQGEGWMDADIYEAAGIPTKRVKDWREAEFVRQMRAGFIQLFPLGLEETLTYFEPHFQQFEPELVADKHILIRYPWFRFAWISKEAENGEALYEALSRGFDQLVAEDQFLELHGTLRTMPAQEEFDSRQIIEIENPFYGYDLVPEKYRHLLFAGDQ